MILKRDIIILFVVAFVSLILAISVQKSDVRTTNNEINTLAAGSELRFDDIQNISIRRDGIHLEFEKNEGAWRQVLPFPLRMDPSSMLAIIESVQGVQVFGDLTEQSSDDVLGLGESADFIVLSDGDHAEKFILGRKTLGGRAYAKIDGGVPVLVSQSLHRRAIDMDYRLWRDVRLFPDFAIDGNRIRRDVNGDRLLIERIEGRWEMREPVSVQVDQEMLTEWVGTLAAARVGMYVVDEPSDVAMFGLEFPSATFTVADRNGNEHSLWIGGRVSAGSQDRYVMISESPVIFRMRMDALKQLFPVPEMFIDSTGSEVSKFDVKQIVLRMDGNELKVTRNIDRWIDENGIQADDASIDSLLSWILETRPASVAIAQYPRDREVASVTLVGYDMVPLDTVRIALDASEQWILENGDNVLRLHPTESGAALNPFR